MSENDGLKAMPENNDLKQPIDTVGTGSVNGTAMNEQANVAYSQANAQSGQPHYQATGNATSDVMGGEPSPKKDRKKLWVTLGIIAGVIVVAAIGFGIWHETPGFCNAVCHKPMDYYVQTYDERNPNNGVTVHAENGQNCLSCHVPTIAEQVSEVINWVSDTFPMDQNGVMLASGKEFATADFCARSGCHNNANNMKEVIASTWGFAGNDEKYNPHASHQDFALECNDCHGIHDGNVLVCNQCHALNMPEGWVTPNEAMLAQSKAASQAATSSDPQSTMQALNNAASSPNANGTFDTGLANEIPGGDQKMS